MRKRLQKPLLWVICLAFFLPAAGYSDATENQRQLKKSTEMAFTGGVGTGAIPEGHYQPILLIWRLGRNLNELFPSLSVKSDNFTCFLEFQLNPSNNPEENFEFGVSPGIQYRYPFTKKLAGFIMASVGPHYMSLVTENQENGFIFSDTIGGGLYYSLNDTSALTLGYRWRHLSNGGMRMPNDGINTDFITLGYALFF